MVIFLDDVISGIFLVISIILIFLGFGIFRYSGRKYSLSLIAAGIILLLGSLYWFFMVLLDQPREFYYSVIIWFTGAVALSITILLWRFGK